MDKCGFAKGKSKHMEAEGLLAYSSGKNEWNERDQSTSAAFNMKYVFNLNHNVN